MASGPPIPPHPIEMPLPRAHEHNGVRTLAAVPYTVSFGQRPVEMDIHLPRHGTEPHPVVIYVHGGAFLFGDRRDPGPMYWEHADNQFTSLPREGIAIASVDYRLAHEATYPAQLEDLIAAQQFLVARADELGIDPTRIGVWGESAGAHLGMLLALHGAPGCPPIAAIVDWFGPSDLGLPFGDLPIPGPTPEERLIGGSLADNADLVAHASPVNHVGADSPPILIVHGTGDTVVPVHHSHALETALREAGAQVEVLWLDDADHAWIGAPDAASEAQAATYAYLRRQLLPT